ncbi:hypothetical protein LIER_42563 [Lithospermum erythrorhizon]|uniref:Uncharacterized protein n=1 Tax=Lithospermum erythrorhizon TaxID=34254 RepID=A0AAV3NJC7_LITER
MRCSASFLYQSNTDKQKNILILPNIIHDSISINIGPHEDSGENRSDVLKLSADQLKEFKNLEDRLQTLKGPKERLYYNSLGLEHSIEFARLNMQYFLDNVDKNQENGVAITIASVVALTIVTLSD